MKDKKAALGLAACSACPLNKPLCELSLFFRVFDSRPVVILVAHTRTLVHEFRIILNYTYIVIYFYLQFVFNTDSNEQTDGADTSVFTSVTRVRYAQVLYYYYYCCQSVQCRFARVKTKGECTYCVFTFTRTYVYGF